MYGLPTFLTIESSTYRAGSFRVGAVYMACQSGMSFTGAEMFVVFCISRSIVDKVMAEKGGPHLSDVHLQGLGQGLCMFDVLFRDDGQVADLVTIVNLKVVQAVFKVSRYFFRSRRRHDGQAARS